MRACSIMFQGNQTRHTIRLAQDGVDPIWSFWIEVPPGEEVRIELALAYIATTSELEAICSEMPSWVSVAASTVFKSSWTYS